VAVQGVGEPAQRGVGQGPDRGHGIEGVLEVVRKRQPVHGAKVKHAAGFRGQRAVGRLQPAVQPGLESGADSGVQHGLEPGSGSCLEAGVESREDHGVGADVLEADRQLGRLVEGQAERHSRSGVPGARGWQVSGICEPTKVQQQFRVQV
jgi:hypothetical protein